jgi:hypothetical protein
MPALLLHRLAHRLAGMEIVAEIDRVQPFVAGAVPFEPAPHGAALAVLLVVTILRPDELGLKRHHLGMARSHDRGAEQGVEILGRLTFPGAGGAVRTLDLRRAVVLGTVERDQHVRTEPPESLDPAGALERRNRLAKAREQVIGRDRIEHGADVIVAGDAVDAEQGLAVRAAVAGLELALMIQEGRALGEEHREGG